MHLPPAKISRIRSRLLAGSVVLTGFLLGSASAALATGFPQRPNDAMTGSDFARQTNGMAPANRERLVLSEFRKGNVPSFLRQSVPVNLSWQDVSGASHTGVIQVLPDYLAIGSDADFLRIPLTPMTAQLVADEFGFVLPTPKLVDEINRQADVHLIPAPLPVRGAKMTTSDTFLKHNRMIENQRRGRGTGKLTSGHKKDVVITNRLAGRPNQVAIYGWHRANGKPIQPLSLVHESTYADYSHGIRLVGRAMIVDGVLMSTDDALRGEKTCRALSYEGKMRVTRARTTGFPSSRAYLASNSRRSGARAHLKGGGKRGKGRYLAVSAKTRKQSYKQKKPAKKAGKKFKKAKGKAGRKAKKPAKKREVLAQS